MSTTNILALIKTAVTKVTAAAVTMGEQSQTIATQGVTISGLNESVEGLNVEKADLTGQIDVLVGQKEEMDAQHAVLLEEKRVLEEKGVADAALIAEKDAAINLQQADFAKIEAELAVLNEALAAI